MVKQYKLLNLEPGAQATPTDLWYDFAKTVGRHIDERITGSLSTEDDYMTEIVTTMLLYSEAYYNRYYLGLDENGLSKEERKESGNKE